MSKTELNKSSVYICPRVSEITGTQYNWWETHLYLGGIIFILYSFIICSIDIHVITIYFIIVMCSIGPYVHTGIVMCSNTRMGMCANTGMGMQMAKVKSVRGGG